MEIALPGSIPADPNEIKKTDQRRIRFFYFMVEAMGIEPMSESIFTGVSPSAAFVLKFRLKHRPKAGYIISYPVSPLCCRAFT